MYKIVLDTNVVVDYLMGRETACSDCKQLILAHEAGRHAVYVSALSLKDAFFLVSMQLKRMERRATGDLSDAMAKAAKDVAWACVQQLVDCLLVVPVGRGESFRALAYRSVHDDFGDDLIVAAALHAGADYLVTNDETLLKHAPIACLSSADMLAMLEAEQLAGMNGTTGT